MLGSSPAPLIAPLIVPLITADALRATIRAGELLHEVQSYGGSLSRGLHGQSCAEPLYAELTRLRGLGDLLIPVSTTREISERARRLDMLFGLLPVQPSLVQAAQNFVASDAAVSEQKIPALTASLRGELIAADERAARVLDKKVASMLAVASDDFAGQRQAALSVLQLEAADWRILEHSALANRLIADHGFADTYGQARKCARGVIKAQAGSGKALPKLSDIKALRRWHEALQVQLRALASVGSLSPELETLEGQLTDLGERLSDWLATARLRRVSGLGKPWKARFGRVLEAEAAQISVSLQRIYGPSKANFRTLIVSELA